jgi:4-hydroxy-4-methyl-2-oxoglutarate aldolase
MPHAIKPVSPAMRICGSAVTVQCVPGDNLWIHRALNDARAGDVLVVHVAGTYDHGYWGEVMSTAAKARALSGLVIDGCVRDVQLLEQIGFPVFARGLCIRGTGKDPAGLGFINTPTLFGDVVVNAGDVVLGDRDGVVVVERARARDVIEAARLRDIDESAICERLVAGEDTLTIYGWK